MLLVLHIITFITWFVLMFACYRIPSWVKRWLTVIGTTIAHRHMTVSSKGNLERYVLQKLSRL